MKLSLFIGALCAVVVSLTSMSSQASIVETGDLNIINDAGNASNGLRYLDLTYGAGLSKAAALANAQATYANARLATASEFDDLFAAAGITYDGSFTAADSFTSGASQTISSGANYDGAILRDQLGITWTGSGGVAWIWTDDDGIVDDSSTRDWLWLSGSNAFISQDSFGAGCCGYVSVLLVSDAAAVPVPAAGWLFMSALAGLIGKKRLSRR